MPPMHDEGDVTELARFDDEDKGPDVIPRKCLWQSQTNRDRFPFREPVIRFDVELGVRRGWDRWGSQTRDRQSS